MEDDNAALESVYTEAQSMILTIIPWITAPISVLSSLILIRIIWIDRKVKLEHTYHRLLLSMSCMDVINSLNLAQSGWVVPTGTPGVWGANGTTATCDVNGFFFHVGFSVALYTASLSIYYLLVIRFEFRPSTIRRYVEPWMHVVAVLYPVVAASVGVFSGMMNPMKSLSGWCYFAYYPLYCETQEDIECTRGMGYETLEMYTTALSIVVCFVVVIICLGLVVRTVCSRERRTSSISTLQADRRYYRTREVSFQALLYIGCFVVTFLPLAFISVAGISRPFTAENRNYYFVIVTTVKVMYPLQGLWNLFIYMRPRVKSLARRHSDWSWSQVVSESLHFRIVKRQRQSAGNDSIQEEGAADAVNDGSKCEEDDFAPELSLLSETEDSPSTEDESTRGEGGFASELSISREIASICSEAPALSSTEDKSQYSDVNSIEDLEGRLQTTARPRHGEIHRAGPLAA